MPGIARVGIDSAGGVITGGMQGLVTINGAPVSVVGDDVAGHGTGSHAGPKMAQGSSLFTINGIPVCLAGHRASCGHEASGDAKHTCSR